jgi:16S rRNA (cytidine1402-2'-O)-methyltransferase
MALMASGLNGQRFAFHGYLPIDKTEAAQTLKALVRESRQRQQTQIFIETPYRNNAVFAILLNELPAEAKLTVALDLTGKQESIVTHTIAEWKRRKQEWPKLPAVFLFLA